MSTYPSSIPPDVNAVLQLAMLLLVKVVLFPAAHSNILGFRNEEPYFMFCCSQSKPQTDQPVYSGSSLGSLCQQLYELSFFVIFFYICFVRWSDIHFFPNLDKVSVELFLSARSMQACNVLFDESFCMSTILPLVIQLDWLPDWTPWRRNIQVQGVSESFS